MKRTQSLDACRNIRKELVAFVSIVMIGMMAATAYLSVAYAAATLKKDALRFFNSRELWDLELSSTALLDGDDLAAVKALPGVKAAESVYRTDARLILEGDTANVAVVSRPEAISLPELQEGRMPETAAECAVEKELVDRQGLSIGQRIELDDDTDMLREKRPVITGVFQTPDNITYMIPATPYILVTEDSFNLEALDGAFMKIRVRIDAPEDRYSEAYWEAVGPVEEALTALGETRAPIRADRQRSAWEEKLNEGQEELKRAAQELREGREKSDEGRREMDAAAEQLGLGGQELDDGRRQLNDAEAQIDASGEKLKANKEKLDGLVSILPYGPGFVLSVVTENDWPSDAAVDYAEFTRALRAGEVDEAWVYENSGYNAGARKLAAARAEYEAARNDWYYLGEEYLDGLARLEAGRKQLESAERELEEAQEKYDEAEQKLQAGREELEQLGEGRWIVLSNKGNAGYLYAQENFEKLDSLSMSFSAIFLVVGALVIYATIGRMVEQQRSLVGATKAMGLYNREIFAKYLFFACTATMLGVGIGILASWLSLQRVILNSYEPLFTYGTGTRSFLPLDTGLVAVGAFAISTVAVYLGCSQLLRLPAIRLMQGTTPSAGRRKARKSAEKTLYSRLILLNMRTDWQRVLVTVVSIAGGCLLMVVGFTLRYGISGVTDRQFGEIVSYEAEVLFNSEDNETAASELRAILEQNHLSSVTLRKEATAFGADGSLEAVTLIIAEPGTMEGYFKLRDIDSGAPIEPPDSGALVPRRFWECYGVGRGENITVYDAQMRACALPISGVFENYYGQIFFLSPQSYEACFGAAAEPNCLFVKTGDLSLDELEALLSGVEGFVRVDDAAADRVIIDQFSAALSFVVWFMLFLAGLMACFIVANFTVTYLQRKTGELTIMRINGFAVGECVRYAAVDLVVTTVLGTILGLILGGIIGRHILLITETSYIQMIREPTLQSYLYSALVTCGFSALTNGVALRRIKHLRLSDIS